MLRPAKAAQSQQYTIEIRSSDRQRLKAYMSHELAMYNKLNSELVRLLHRDPTTLANISPYIDVYSDIAAGLNIQTKDDVKTDVHAAIKPKLDKTILMIISDAMNKIAVLPEIKKAFCAEILRLYNTTAKAMTSSKMNSVQQEFLETLDDGRKRHVQMHKKHVSIVYDTTANRTVLTTPYTEHPIYINGVDATKDSSWKFAIIHQKPGRPPNADTPWMIDLRSGSEEYLLKYMEMLNPYGSSVHHHAAKNFRSVNF